MLTKIFSNIFGQANVGLQFVWKSHPGYDYNNTRINSGFRIFAAVNLLLPSPVSENFQGNKEQILLILLVNS